MVTNAVITGPAFGVRVRRASRSPTLGTPRKTRAAIRQTSVTVLARRRN